MMIMEILKTVVFGQYIYKVRTKEPEIIVISNYQSIWNL